MLRKMLLIFSVTALWSSSSVAMTMQELFDAVNAYGNTSSPAVLQGQTMNMYTGGSLFMRAPKRTYSLVTATPPSWNAGCGGIDLYMGGFSFINKEQFVSMLRNIGSNAVGYSFKLALQNLCPTCDNVMQSLQAIAQQINRQNIDSCEAAKGLVNASLPDTWTRGKQNAAKNFGVDTNIFENITDAWTHVMNDENQANSTINDVASARPEARDTLPTGNVTWKALKKLDGLTDEYRMILMSMIGSMIFPTDSPALPKPLIPKSINVETLVGLSSKREKIKVPVWRCDTTSAHGCLNPDPHGFVETKPFKTMVREQMYHIADKIASRSEYDNLAEILTFINATDLPVYKIMAVSTRYGDASLADALIGRYVDLIAAKYAEVYIQKAVRDIRTAFAQILAVSDAAQTAEIELLKQALERISREARGVVSLAYSNTISTYSITQELQHMERAMNANLSQSLRDSLAFAHSLDN